MNPLNLNPTLSKTYTAYSKRFNLVEDRTPDNTLSLLKYNYVEASLTYQNWKPVSNIGARKENKPKKHCLESYYYKELSSKGEL